MIGLLSNLRVLRSSSPVNASLTCTRLPNHVTPLEFSAPKMVEVEVEIEITPEDVGNELDLWNLKTLIPQSNMSYPIKV